MMGSSKAGTYRSCLISYPFHTPLFSSTDPQHHHSAPLPRIRSAWGLHFPIVEPAPGVSACSLSPCSDAHSSVVLSVAVAKHRVSSPRFPKSYPPRDPCPVLSCPVLSCLALLCSALPWTFSSSRLSHCRIPHPSQRFALVRRVPLISTKRAWSTMAYMDDVVL